MIRCAFCHDPDPAELLRCPRCGSLYHPECRADNGGRCPSCGRKGDPVWAGALEVGAPADRLEGVAGCVGLLALAVAVLCWLFA